MSFISNPGIALLSILAYLVMLSVIVPIAIENANYFAINKTAKEIDQYKKHGLTKILHKGRYFDRFRDFFKRSANYQSLHSELTVGKI